MSKKTRIFILPLVFSGHINPISGVVRELCQLPDVECIMYGTDEYKQIIERTGAQYRMYAHRQWTGLTVAKMTDETKNNFFSSTSQITYDASMVLVPQLLDDVIRDKPDLIFFDAGFIIARFLAGALQRKGIHVKFAEFFPNFAYTDKMLKKNPDVLKFNIGLILTFMGMYFRMRKLSWKH